MIRVVFVLRRFHGNLRMARSFIQGSGGQTMFIVQNHSKSDPIPFPDSILWSDLSGNDAEIMKTLRFFKPDLIVQRDFSSGMVGIWRAARGLGVPSALYDQGPQRIGLTTLLTDPRRTLGFCIRFLTARLYLGKFYRVTPVFSEPKKWEVQVPRTIYMPLPSPPACKVESPSSDVPHVLTIGKLGQSRKRLHWLLRYLEDHPRSFTLEIIGWLQPYSRYQEKLLARAQFLSRFGEGVQVKVDLDFDGIMRCISKSDIYVLPSRRELFAYSPIEAMSRGRAILISSRGGARSYVRSGWSRQLFREHSYRDFERKLHFLLSSGEARARLGRENLRSVDISYSSKTFLASLQEAQRLSRTLLEKPPF